MSGLQRRFGVRASVVLFPAFLIIIWQCHVFSWHSNVYVGLFWCSKLCSVLSESWPVSLLRRIVYIFTAVTSFQVCFYIFLPVAIFYYSVTCDTHISSFLSAHTCRNLWTHILIPTHPHDYLCIYTHYFIIQDCICIYTFIYSLRLVEVVG